MSTKYKRISHHALTEISKPTLKLLNIFSMTQSPKNRIIKSQKYKCSKRNMFRCLPNEFQAVIFTFKTITLNYY